MFFYSILTFIFRILLSRLILTLNYIYIDKNNPLNTLSSQQITLEGNSQVFHLYLHLFVMSVLEFTFQDMFYNNNQISLCAIYTVVCHILINEPLYYVFHYFLHTKYLYTKMHREHHSSVKTIPNTTALQNKIEHILYVIIFAPATLLPYIYNKQQNGIVIMLYLI